MYKIKMSPISPQCSHFKLAQVNLLQKIYKENNINN